MDTVSLTGTFSTVDAISTTGLAWNGDDDASTLPHQLPDNLYTFILIPCAADNVAGRDQLRGSWLRTLSWSSPVLNRAAPQPSHQQAWDYGFFVGGGEDGISVGQASPRMLGDIVRLAAPDDYARLGDKVLAALAWAEAHVRAEFFLKLDTDTWVHPERLNSWLAEFAAPEVSQQVEPIYHTFSVRYAFHLAMLYRQRRRRGTVARCTRLKAGRYPSSAAAIGRSPQPSTPTSPTLLTPRAVGTCSHPTR